MPERSQIMTVGAARRRRRGLAIGTLALALAAAMLTAPLLATPVANAVPVQPVPPLRPIDDAGSRIAGVDRYDTAARIALAMGSASPSIIIANGEDAKKGFDALSANYPSGIIHAPILLTRATSLPPVTAAAVRTLLSGAKTPRLQIVVMGKADSVSDAVADELTSIARKIVGDNGKYVVRVAGNDRYETSANAATSNGDDPKGYFVGKYAFGAGASPNKTAILASGEVNADALAAGPLSNALRIPVLLTDKDALPPSVASVLTSQGIKNVIVLGQPDRVSQTVLDQAKAAGVTTIKRIAGGDRYGTSAELYAFALGTLTDSDGKHYGDGTGNGSKAYLANGQTGFPDALAVGPLAAQHQDVLLTSPADQLPPALTTFLTAKRSSLDSAVALGKTATISSSVLQAALTAIE